MKKTIPSFLLYGLSFFLLWEWLRPVEQLTDTKNLETFVSFSLLSFACSFFSLKRIWKFIIKLLYILFFINRFHYKEGFFQLSWFRSFITDIPGNMEIIWNRQWNDVSNEFRTLLFFVLLWIMVYLIDYWLLNRQRIFIFFFMTLVYITVLDTFTPYQANAAIVRTVVAGFTVMGMLTFYRMIQKENVSYDSSFLRKWMVPLAGMIVFSVLLGFIAPKAEPIWPDPVPYLTANNDKVDNRAGGLHRIGYGTNDTNLGGPFIGDDNPVFAYEGSGKNYWKMETKDVYTGKGWVVSESNRNRIAFTEADPVPVESLSDTVATVKKSARVILNGSYDYNYFMYPAGITKLLKVQPSNTNGNKIELDTTNERIGYFNSDQQPVTPSLFSVEFDSPEYNAKDLMMTTEIPANMNPQYIEKYTTLPESLPARVKELAEKITAGKTNWFDKAKAVESYFSHSDFTYDQKDVAVPGVTDDYVDQFLFDTKRGYCDNFSTSMAVLLRTIGIPTRWVKGYTGGDFQEYSEGDSSTQMYQVTNNNAHSWVEVYFPNQGWVPFEPTMGFSNGITINYQLDSGTASNSQETKPVDVKKPQQEEAVDTAPKTETKKFSDVKTVWNSVKNHWIRSLLILILLAGCTATLYRYRGKWAPYGILLHYKFKKKDESLESAYLVLLNQLDRYGLKRKDHQTLRHYAHYIDTFFSTREMTKLTSLYEQLMYRQNLPEGTWKESRELWENLIKKTIA